MPYALWLCIVAYMTTIHRLEDPAHLDAGGVLITYPSGYRQQLSWQWSGAVDVGEMAKELAQKALSGLMDGGRPGWEGDVRDTNWVSLTAGLGRVVRDWLAKRGAGAPGEGPQTEVGVTPS